MHVPAAFLRASLSLRGGLAQQSLGCLAVRQFSTNDEVGECLVGPTSMDPEAAMVEASSALSDSAASLDASATAVADAVTSVDVSGPISLAIQAVDALHAATGLPWWATISAVGIAVRLAMMPITLKGMKASSAAIPLLQRARQEAAEAHAGAGGSFASSTAPTVAASSDDRQEQQQPQAQVVPQQEEPQQQPQQGQPSLGEIVSRFDELRRQHGAPHPAWIIGSPLIQFPVFITSMWSIRMMSLHGWEGFKTGGLAWFTDLTLPAMDLASLTAPMGNFGIILPLTVAVSMYANIDMGFSLPAAASKQQSPVTLWVMDKLRLLLEWMVVPMFVISLQLPQGALCYWATTSTFSLVQNAAFRDPAVRRVVGLPTGRQGPLPPPISQLLPMESLESIGKTEVEAEFKEHPGWSRQDEAELRQFLVTTRDQMKLFERAAELRVEGKVGAAITVLRRLVQLYPKQPRAMFALGQMHALLRDWHASEQYYIGCANNEPDKHQQGRAWFGAGVALHMQQEHDTAIQAFQKAAELAQEDELRVRAWVSEATLQKKLGNIERAVELLRQAAEIEPKVEELYLRPLLEEIENQKLSGRRS